MSLLGMTVKKHRASGLFRKQVVLLMKKNDQMISDLEAEDSAARMAIKLRYENASKEAGANIKAFAEEQSREIEELNANYQAKKLSSTVW